MNSHIKVVNTDMQKFYLNGPAGHTPETTVTESCCRVLAICQTEQHFFTLDDEGNIKRYSFDDNRRLVGNTVQYLELTLPSQNRLKKIFKLRKEFLSMKISDKNEMYIGGVYFQLAATRDINHTNQTEEMCPQLFDRKPSFGLGKILAPCDNDIIWGLYNSDAVGQVHRSDHAEKIVAEKFLRDRRAPLIVSYEDSSVYLLYDKEDKVRHYLVQLGTKLYIFRSNGTLLQRVVTPENQEMDVLKASPKGHAFCVLGEQGKKI